MFYHVIIAWGMAKSTASKQMKSLMICREKGEEKVLCTPLKHKLIKHFSFNHHESWSQQSSDTHTQDRSVAIKLQQQMKPYRKDFEEPFAVLLIYRKHNYICIHGVLTTWFTIGHNNYFVGAMPKFSHLQLHGSQVQFDPHLQPFSAPEFISDLS